MTNRRKKYAMPIMRNILRQIHHKLCICRTFSLHWKRKQSKQSRTESHEIQATLGTRLTRTESHEIQATLGTRLTRTESHEIQATLGTRLGNTNSINTRVNPDAREGKAVTVSYNTTYSKVGKSLVSYRRKNMSKEIYLVPFDKIK